MNQKWARTWIAVLSQSKLKIFERAHRHSPLVYIDLIENDEVHLRNLDITRHKPGFAPKGSPQAISRHVMNSGVNPHQQIVERFIKSSVQKLERQFHENGVEHLIVIAEPRTLGLFRSAASDQFRKRVIAWINNDAEHATTASLERILEKSEVEALV